MTAETIDIGDFGRALRRHGMRSGSGVPCSFFKPLVNYMYAEDELDYVPAASEGEAVAIAAGMVAAGSPAFALMQNSGFGNAVNPITSLLYIYQIPVALFVSHRGQPGLSDEPQHERMGVVTKDMIELCGIEGYLLSAAELESTVADTQSRGVPAAWLCQKGTLTGGPPPPAVETDYRISRRRVPEGDTPVPQIAREEALRAILPLLNEGVHRPAVISTTGKLSRELYELDDREHGRANRFYMVGSMGCASGFGLGVARARPGKVVVLDGDGALLMKMGTLATVGWMGQKNLHHVVIDNAAHDSTGGQPTASPHVDFGTVALACGYLRADTVCTADGFESTLREHLASDGPTLLRMLVTTGARKDLGRPKLAPRDAYARFRDWLGSSP